MKNLVLQLPDPQGTPRPIEVPPQLPTGGLEGTGIDVIQLIISLLFAFGIILAFISIMYSGAQMIISEGEKQKLQNARNRFIYSIVGLIIIILAFLIKNTIVRLLGADTRLLLNTP